MSILIKGLKMPKNYGDYDATFSVMPDGEIGVVWACEFDPTIDESCGDVFHIPPHGRLIDADKFCRCIANLQRIDPIIAAGIIAWVKSAPTVIEADATSRKE